MKHTKIRANYACRKCLNRKYGLHLEREDCLYHLYPNKCRQCGEICNIVADVRWTRQWKLWFAKED